MKKISSLLFGALFVAVVSLAQPALAAEPSIANFVSNPAVFNTDTGSAVFSYTLNNVTNGQVVLTIYDSANNLIKTIYAGTQSSGEHLITWDGKDNANQPVNDGNYTAKLAVTYGSGNNYTFVLKWGYFYPYGIAVDSDNNVYVADTYYYRIQKFTSNGNFITKWGSNGSGDGQFSNPYGIAVDSDNNVYVTDTYNRRIQKFDSNGNFIATWGSYGSGDGQFLYPYGIAVDSDNNVYVTDVHNYRIQKFDSNGNFITKWGSYGSGDGQFSYPFGIAVDSSNNVYVTDIYGYRIQKFDSNGNFLATWGSRGSGDGQFLYPYGIAVDSSNNVYVADTYYNRIQKFTSNGNFITKWGSYGSGDGQFYYPYGIAVDSSNNVYVTDTWNYRIQKFAPPTASISAETNVIVDNTAPITAISLSGTLGDNSWYVSDVGITLTATDDHNIAKTEYSFDNINWNTYNSPFAISSEGATTIYYRSVDEAGNTETAKTETFKMDKTAPEIAIISPIAADYEHPEIINIDFTAVDNVAGIVETSVKLDGKEYASSTIDLLSLSLGSHTFTITSKNNAGLTAIKSIEFKVVANIDSLISIVNRFYKTGEIDNKGIMNSLIAKLETAKGKINSSNSKTAKNILQAFINEIEVQSGKHISEAAANILKNDATYLIEQL